jgi:hypothetical protein
VVVLHETFLIAQAHHMTRMLLLLLLLLAAFALLI